MANQQWSAEKGTRSKRAVSNASGGSSPGQERIERGGYSGTLNAVSHRDEITSGFACRDYGALDLGQYAGDAWPIAMLWVASAGCESMPL